MSISEQHLKALGRVVVNFQGVEFAIGMAISGCVSRSDQNVGHMIVSQVFAFDRLCKLAGALFDHLFPGTEQAERFQALLTLALQLEGRRNQLFHSTWAEDLSGEQVSRIKISLDRTKGLKFASPVVTADEINGLATEMASVSDEIIKLLTGVPASAERVRGMS